MSFKVKARRLFKLFVSLSNGSDIEGTIEEISSNVALRGANIWMLICSAVLACIGLDVNSTAVIIGAMLISPLMSPILGVGLSIAIFDRRLLKNSTKNLILAIFVSLLTSLLYFSITPFGEMTPELEARTTPTILDVCVAFFGGIAGVVAGSRMNKTNAVPGVAIATALMPPLCTAGFGLATLNSGVFLGAFYLFFINAFFISLATYLISILLKFPKRTQLDETSSFRFKGFIIVFAVLVTIPSALIFYNVLQKLQFDKNVKNFVNKEVRRESTQPIQWDVSDDSLQRTLKIYTVGAKITDEQTSELKNLQKDYSIENLKLKIIQLNVSPDDFSRLTSNVETNIAEKINLIQKIEEENKESIENLKNEIVQLKENSDPNQVFIKDIFKVFPELEKAEWLKPTTENESNTSNSEKFLQMKFKKETPEAVKKNISEQVLKVARSRFFEKDIRVIEEKEENKNEKSVEKSVP